MNSYPDIKKIATNAGSLFINSIFRYLTSSIFVVILARYMGKTAFGKYSMAFALPSMLLFIPRMGFQKFITREIANQNAKGSYILGNVLFLQFLLSIVAMLVLIGLSFLSYHDNSIRLLIFIAGISSLIISPIKNSSYGVFQGYERMSWIPLCDSLANSFVTIISIIAVLIGRGLLTILLLNLLGSIISSSISLAVVNYRFNTVKLYWDLKFWKRSIKISGTFALSDLFSSVFTYFDVYLLSQIKGNEVVGLYSAASKLILSLSIIPGAIMSAIFPNFARMHFENSIYISKTFEKSVQYLAMIAFPFGVGITLFAEEIITLLYGEQYYPSIQILRILSWVSVITFINWPLYDLLDATNRQNKNLISCSLCSASNVIFNLVLIPHYGAIGAAIAFVGAYTIFLCSNYCFVKCSFPMFPFWSKIYKSILASVIMAIIMILFRVSSFYVNVIFAIFAYTTILLLVGGFGEEERVIVSKLYKYLFKYLFNIAKKRY